MLRSPREVVLVALVIVAGLAVGGMLGLRARAGHRAAPLVAAARVTAAPHATAVATPAATPRTAAPAATRAPAAAVTAAPAASAAPATVAGTWRIVETNTSAGTIVWAGTATATRDAVALDVRKTEVGGRAVGPCERATHLRATLGAGASSAPYEETNCSGTTSAGEMRIAWRSPDGRALRGAFWKNGSKLGDFTATGS